MFSPVDNFGIIDAYAGEGSKPHWRIAGHISGGIGIDDAMSLEMRSFVQRTVREQNELEVSRRRAADRALKDSAEENFGGGGSSSSPPTGGKQGGKGGGKSDRARRPKNPAPKK